MKIQSLRSPSVESSPSPSACYETSNKYLCALGVTADDGRDYLFSAAQFLDAELQANTGVEADEQAPPDRLHVRYASGEMVILGRGLRVVARWLQRGELESLKPLGKRYAGLRLPEPFISSIIVTRRDDV